MARIKRVNPSKDSLKTVEDKMVPYITYRLTGEGNKTEFFNFLSQLKELYENNVVTALVRVRQEAVEDGIVVLNTVTAGVFHTYKEAVSKCNELMNEGHSKNNLFISLIVETLAEIDDIDF